MKLVHAAAAVLTLWTVPASAQMAGTVPAERKVTLGATVGVAAVQKVGGLAGGALTVRLGSKIDLVGEGLWSQNVVTRRRLDLAASLGSYIQSTQLSSASGTLKAPAMYIGGGVRVPILGRRAWQPYLTATAGIARIALRPEITLAGADITSRLPQFGVTLGNDLTGSVSKPAFGAGFGLRTFHGRSYIDLGLKYINIQTQGQPTSVIGAGGSFGFAL